MSRKKNVEDELNDEEIIEEEETTEKTEQNAKVHNLRINHETWKKLMILKLQTDKEFDVLIMEAIENLEG